MEKGESKLMNQKKMSTFRHQLQLCFGSLQKFAAKKLWEGVRKQGEPLPYNVQFQSCKISCREMASYSYSILAIEKYCKEMTICDKYACFCIHSYMHLQYQNGGQNQNVQ